MRGRPTGRAQYEDTTPFLKNHECQPVSGNGTLTADALDASVLRVLQLKLAHGIVPLPETG